MIRYRYALVILVLFVLMAPAQLQTSYADTVNFAFTGGTQNFVVPAGVTSITITASGAQGGAGGGAPGGAGGNGGTVTATVTVSPGETLTVVVGGQGSTGAGGFNGGGGVPVNGGGGGGASDVRQGGTALGDRIVVAGGGGGGASGSGGSGGVGGGLTGATGGGPGGGGGGTQAAGGASGGGTATAGSSGDGGDGGSGANAGGGGGGGFFGGGGGSDGVGNSGGGGGSSFTIGTATGVSHTQGANSGNGQVTITYSISVESGGDGCIGDCTPPTLGLDENGRRLVTDGFSYNGDAVNVEQYYTPYPLITVQTAKNNIAVFKIYENEGTDNVAHFELAFGLAQGQILADSRAVIIWDRTFDGIETVTLNDPQNALDGVSVSSNTGACDGGTIPCLVLSIQHIFREPLEFDIVATNVWDHSGNAWQNYYNHGIHVTGESLNPPDAYTGIHRGHMYHLTETGKNTAVDEFGNMWSFDYGIWSMDYVPAPRPQDGNWQVMTRYHSGFEEYKKEQILIAEKTLDGILGYKQTDNQPPTSVAGPQPGAHKRQTDEFYSLLESEHIRAQALYDILYKD